MPTSSCVICTHAGNTPHCVHSKQKTGAKGQHTARSAAPEATELSSSAAANRRDDQDCLFLSGVRLHLCCCNPDEQLQLVRIAREGCALRHTDLSPGLTHIVVSTARHGCGKKCIPQVSKAYLPEHTAFMPLPTQSDKRQMTILARHDQHLVMSWALLMLLLLAALCVPALPVPAEWLHLNL